MYLGEKTSLQLIAYSKDQKQKCQLMKCMNHDQYFELKKIAINILHGVIPLKRNQLKYFKKSKQFIWKLAEGNLKIHSKPKIIWLYVRLLKLHYNTMRNVQKLVLVPIEKWEKLGQKNEPVKEVLVKTVPLKNQLPLMKAQVNNHLPKTKVWRKNQLGQGTVMTSSEYQIFPRTSLKKKNKSLSLLYYLKKIKI